jgi:hypothetical protein
MLANCAAMNIPPREARDLTLWEYEATLVQWNAQHDTGEPKVEAPTVDEVQASEQFFLDHPELLQARPDELMN